MSGFSLILLYSSRIVRRQWRRFVLPFLSLTVTGVVLLLVLLLTSSGAQLLAEESRMLQGGDVVFESALPIDGGALLSEVGVVPEAVSEQQSFTATFSSASATAPFSVHAVDAAFPLYGNFVLESGEYRGVSDTEVLIDRAGAERLGVTVGSLVTFGNATYTVASIIISEPTSLFGGFEFFPHIFMSIGGFKLSAVDTNFLRVEYSYAAKVEELTTDTIGALRGLEERESQLDVDIAGQDQRGLQFGFETISDFLTIAVLVTAVLAAVNVYASTVYLVTVERKSLAVLLALGLKKRSLTAILGTSLMSVVLVASLVAVLWATYFYQLVQEFVATTYLISLPTPPYLMDSGIAGLLLIGVAIASFIPAVRKSLALNPRQILIGSESQEGAKLPVVAVLYLTLIALLPLCILAIFLLRSITDGVITMVGILLGYTVIAGLSMLALSVLYARRAILPFPVRAIVSQKKADGFFGIISFTSLFVAVTALFTLALLQISLERFLVGDLQRTIPTSYVVDVQPSQKDTLLAGFPEVTLFSNIGARIVAIDALRIQDELANDNPEVDRELGREFSLTARGDLLASETVVAGAWSNGKPGEVSVDEDFAERADISLGSTIVFSIQGFEVTAVVSSLRSTDSRSGLPFFYFVLSPADLEAFPSVYFGYANYDQAAQAALGRFLASEMPNVSLIETEAIGPLVLRIVKTLLVLVFVVTLPPLLIATLLIATLVVSSYATRKRAAARLRALGATKRYAFYLYLAETISTAAAAILFAYGASCLTVLAINYFVLELTEVVLFAPELIMGVGLILFFICAIAWYLFKTDTMQLRELLSYE
jgi:putative ABC transport system permease protein